MSVPHHVHRIARALALAGGTLALLPATASAHTLIGRFESPLPLAAYLGGAAVAVGLSFALVILRSGADHTAEDVGAAEEGRLVRVPRALRLTLRVLGLVAWLWIIVQGVTAGQSSDADVGSLFLWTYGWVLIPILCAFVGPIWEWLDPFRTLFDIGAATVRRLNIKGWRTAAYPASLERWPAVVALVVFIWLELVYTSARGGRTLAVVVVAYTAWTLLMMAQFGRDTWRRNGDAFTAWFRIFGRIAPLAATDEEAESVRVRPYGVGLLTAGWLRTELILVAVATAGILYDGLSQTQIWFDAFGHPAVPAATVQMGVFIAAIVALVLLTARVVGIRAMAAGLVPIALGYLIAHYSTALVFDGQRIVTVLSDPFNAGWNFFGTATFEPNETFLPYGIIWAIELVAVVGGHVYGAVMGHRAAVADGLADGRTPADVRARQVPLAILMVFLTALTLWSLGQNLVQTTPAVT